MRTFLGGMAVGAMLTGATLTVMQSKQGAGSPSGATARTPQFENDAVKVWRTVVQPGQPTSLHRHDHPRVAVALTSGTMEFANEDGTKEEHVWEEGKAYYLPAMPPKQMHADVNVGGKPLDVMVVELEKEK